MRVVIPITKAHLPLALKVLSWAKTLGRLVDSPALCIHEQAIDAKDLDELKDVANSLFKTVDLLAVDSNREGVLRFHSEGWYYDDPRFIWMSTSTPLRPAWFTDIVAAWNNHQNRTAILGFFHSGWLDDTGVFHKRLGLFAFDLANTATVEHTHLIQSYGRGKGLKTFTDWSDVEQNVDFKASIFCGTDGSLIDRLIERENSVANNVPQHAMEYYEPPLETPPGKVAILIVTYAKDFDWLAYCLRSLKKFATGFDTITVAVTSEDQKLLMAMPEVISETTDIMMFNYRDVHGKGFLMHAYQIGQADVICPDADFILHLDADCIAKEPVDAGHFFEGGKPVLVYRSYESLTDKTTKVVSECAQWQRWAENTIGHKIDAYTMCRQGSIYPRELYPKFRSQVALVHGNFKAHVLAQKNNFPQSYCEFPAMGGYAWNTMRDRFHWVNAEHKAPRDKFKCYWSRAPLRLDTPVGVGFHDGRPAECVGSSIPAVPSSLTARQEIESFLKDV